MANPQIQEVLYRRLKAVQREFGLARFELGTLLEVFRTNEDLWKGRAANFNAFLEEERVSSAGAYQFMRVARKFVLELGLTDADLADLASVNFRVLDAATRIITPENQEEVLALLAALGERDARVALQDYQPTEEGSQTSTVPKEVKSLVRRFKELPDDYRIAFIQELSGGGRSLARP